MTTGQLLAEPYAESLDSILRWPLGQEPKRTHLDESSGTVGGTMERHLRGRKSVGLGLQSPSPTWAPAPTPRNHRQVIVLLGSPHPPPRASDDSTAYQLPSSRGCGDTNAGSTLEPVGTVSAIITGMRELL